jgi:ferredoxin
MSTRRPARIRISVDNKRCHRYGICEAEAGSVFRLTPDGRLRYRARPEPAEYPDVLMAARLCPMQAVTIRERA